jgi:glycerophosphoryl diester phosphodiesterase
VPIYVERLVAISHDIGVRVVVWTVDDPVVIRGLLNAGVGAIITDRPDVLREVLVSRDQWAPMASCREAPTDGFPSLSSVLPAAPHRTRPGTESSSPR